MLLLLRLTWQVLATCRSIHDSQQVLWFVIHYEPIPLNSYNIREMIVVIESNGRSFHWFKWSRVETVWGLVSRTRETRSRDAPRSVSFCPQHLTLGSHYRLPLVWYSPRRTMGIQKQCSSLVQALGTRWHPGPPSSPSVEHCPRKRLDWLGLWSRGRLIFPLARVEVRALPMAAKEKGSWFISSRKGVACH